MQQNQMHVARIATKVTHFSDYRAALTWCWGRGFDNDSDGVAADPDAAGMPGRDMVYVDPDAGITGRAYFFTYSPLVLPAAGRGEVHRRRTPASPLRAARNAWSSGHRAGGDRYGVMGRACTRRQICPEIEWISDRNRNFTNRKRTAKARRADCDWSDV
jgi:hypothetical protein